MAKAVEINNLNSRSLYLKGLDCPDCAAKIEKAVSMIPGVANATVVFPLGKLNIAYDEAQTGVKEVIERVQALGYDAQLDGEADEQYRSTTLRIEGMDCADCAAKLEKHIAHLQGKRGNGQFRGRQTYSYSSGAGHCDSGRHSDDVATRRS